MKCFQFRLTFCFFIVLLASFGMSHFAYSVDTPVIYPQSGNSSGVDRIIFSRDSKYLVSFSLPKGVTVWEVRSGRSFGEFKLDGAVPRGIFSSLGYQTFSEGYRAATSKAVNTERGLLTYSENHEFIAEILNDSAATILIREAKSGKVLHKLGFIRDSIRQIALSGDKQKLYCGSGFSDLVIWDTSGHLALKKPMIGLLGDNRFLCEMRTEMAGMLFFKKQVRMFEITDTWDEKQIAIPLEKLPTGVRIFGLAPQMDKVLLGIFQEPPKYRLIDAGTFEPIRDFEPPSTDNEVEWVMGDFAFSPDGAKLAFNVNDLDPISQKLKQVIYIYDLRSDGPIGKISSPQGLIYGYKFSPVQDAIYVSDGVNIFLEDIGSGSILKKYVMGTKEKSQHFALWGEMAVSPDAGLIAMGDAGGDIHVWNGGEEKERATLTTASDGISSVRITADQRRIWSAGSDDGIVRLTDIASGREIARFISFRDGEWIVMTPEGYYNASENADRYLNVRIGNTIYGIENYRETFYRPDLVAMALAGGSLKAFRHIADVKQPPEVSFLNPPRRVSENSVTLTLHLTDKGGGIGDLRLYLNGSAVWMDRGRGVGVKPSEGGSFIRTCALKLANGKNILRAVAFNKDNTMQSNEAVWKITASSTAMVKPALFGLVIGIDEFKNPKLKLNYSAADARLFADTLQRVGAGLFQEIKIRQLTLQAETTRQAIMQALDSLKQLRPEDLFVFYIASHGTVDEGEYFLITSNVGSLRTEKLRTDAISQNLLKEAVANIPATKKLIIIDTCNAGALGKAISTAMLTRGMSEDTALKILSRSVGSTILSASTSVQEALEGYKGHGLFTYVLAQGMQGKADKGGTGLIKTTELADYVDDQVPVLAEKVFKRAQYPTISISGQAFPIGRVR